LRSTVLFPGVTLPIAAGRAQTLKAIEAALKDPAHRVFAVAQRGDGDDIDPNELHRVGVIATLGSIQRGQGAMRLVLEGERRAIVTQISMRDGYLVATVSDAADLPALDAKDPPFVALVREVRERAAELGTKRGVPAETIEQMLQQVTDPGQLADVVAGYLDVSVAERQSILDALAVEDRLRVLLIQLQRQLNVLAAQQDIQSAVKEEIGGRQREAYLREQMRAIQKELGEGDDAGDEGLKELKAKLDALPLPDEARKEVVREWSRLARIGRESVESQVIRTYLETISELPWGARTDESLDVAAAAKILDEDHFGLGEVKDRVL
jgi:ATP-dependent Lon protease